MKKLGLEKRKFGRNLIMMFHHLKHLHMIPLKGLISETFSSFLEGI